MFAVCAAVTLLGLLGLLWADYKGSRTGAWLTKPVASAAFIAAAVLSGSLGHVYGQWVTAALVLSWFGDVFLIPKSQAIFRLGLVSFLLGHVAFSIAFVARGVDFSWATVAMATLAVIAVFVARWLLPGVPAALRFPVIAYIAVISTMVALATGTHGFAPSYVIIAAALAFYVSDLSVARHRFVKPSFSNKLWGLPLYYGAQVALAWTAGAGY